MQEAHNEQLRTILGQHQFFLLDAYEVGPVSTHTDSSTRCTPWRPLSQHAGASDQPMHCLLYLKRHPKARSSLINSVLYMHLVCFHSFSRQHTGCGGLSRSTSGHTTTHSHRHHLHITALQTAQHTHVTQHLHNQTVTRGPGGAAGKQPAHPLSAA